MSDALAATELVLAREQQLHALDGLAAAAAHELGTPLSTITLVAKELAREAPQGTQFGEDVALLQSQAERCREILRKLTRSPSEPDPLHARMSLTQLIEEALEPHRGSSIKIFVRARQEGGEDGNKEPVVERRPGVIYGLRNLIENAIDFARQRVEITANWTARDVGIAIVDDGPGIAPDVMDALGEPYITTRPGRRGGPTDAQKGLGLGFFIAKTLLERSGASLTLGHREPPEHGAVVRVSWPREAFTALGAGGAPAQGAGASPQGKTKPQLRREVAGEVRPEPGSPSPGA
jgi:two-component system sensor histidine kinase RegB